MIERYTRPQLAEIWSDDHLAKAKFDPDIWFQCATDEEIFALACCGFRGNYPSDAVGEDEEVPPKPLV